MNRTVLTILAVLGAVALVVLYSLRGEPGRVTPKPQAQDPTPAALAPASDAAAAASNPAPSPAAPDAPASTDPAPPSPPIVLTSEPSVDLLVVENPEKQPEPVLGSTDRAGDFEMQVRLTPWGAGVKSIELAHHSTAALEHIPYPIQTAHPRLGYPMAALSVTVNGKLLTLGDRRWTVLAADSNSATFELVIADASTKPVLRIERRYTLPTNSYDLQLQQRFFNLSSSPIEVSFTQAAQGDVLSEGGYLGDKRSIILGYHDLEYDPDRRLVSIGDHEASRADVLKKDRFAQLWPTDQTAQKNHELVFVALNDRYFATAVHLPIIRQSPQEGGAIVRAPLAIAFPVVTRRATGSLPTDALALSLTANRQLIAPGSSASLDISLYAGPKDPDVLAKDPGYRALGLDQLIIYNIGGCCSFLTFSWLAKGLLAFLDLLHAGLQDWGLAIIILVVVVRALLHPITKRSQVNMMKFSKQMQSLQPEMERLKKKWKDDQSKLNQEMMKLYREKGVNPAAMGLGCLPMFLQMPLWIALYAMLFFAIELRHQPAFYDVFHKLAAAMGVQWSFLTDLSSPDNFFKFKPFSVLGLFTLESLNIIPVFMAFVFYIQQKFMQPPASPNMTEQQKQQQKIMKYMTLLFPIFLYKAPSGLTLYIFASTCSGIVDSYFVRKHLKQQEEAGTLFQKKAPRTPKPGGFWDRMQKAAEAKRAQVEAQRKAMEKQAGRSKRK